MAIKNLVIVESPAKAKTIAKYLNASRALRHMGKFSVMASMGHIRDLKNRELSIDVDKDFATQYEVLKDKVKMVEDLKAKAKTVDNIFLAADYDREGEAISEHIRDTLGLTKYQRITFTEITPKALEKAILSPRKIDYNLVNAQETRRILDRLVGFKISPLLWKKYNANKIHLSAGRVQSAALHLVREKEEDVKAFKTSTYWYFNGTFDLTIGDEDHKLEDVKLYDNERVFKIDEDIQQVRSYLSKVTNKFVISDLKTRVLKQNPDLPFITSTLQQEAYSKHGFPLKRTMALAQDLYEKGYITYMRTDSYNISEDFKKEAEAYILTKYGSDYYEAIPKKTKTSKNAQEAHEAIRPTNVNTTVIDELGFTVDHKKLYDMIWKRAVGYLMKATIYDELEIRINDNGLPKSSYFLADFKKVKFNGYMILYGVKVDEYNFQKYIDAIKSKSYKVLCHGVKARNTWTSPPARYNEASIIKTLETESIGRPSTFATILTKLFEKHYILKSDVRGIDKEVTHILYHPTKGLSDKTEIITIGHERSRLVPSDIGIEIDKFMENNFNYIIDRKFTANMEEDLDKIAEGSITKSNVLGMFWKTFGADVEKIESVKKAEKVKIETQHLSYNINGIEYIIRLSKYGPVIQYKPYPNAETDKFIDIKAYLKYTSKSYTNVSQEDVTFLTNLPRKVASINGKNIMLTAGPYGLYFKYGDENVKIPLKMIKRLLDPEDKVEVSELDSVLQYHKKKQEAKGDKKEVNANTSASNKKTNTNTNTKVKAKARTSTSKTQQQKGGMKTK
jgi:DNA topoisomerase-1